MKLLNKIETYVNARRAFSLRELLALIKTAFYFYIFRIDPLYQSKYENEYTTKFSKFMGGGFADAVNSGTAACYIALRSLKIEPSSNVGVSCFTDPGVYNSIILSGLNPIPLSFKNSLDWHIDIDQLEEQIKKFNLKALLIVHTFGDIEKVSQISNICKEHNIFLVEDLSQCHGGHEANHPVGSYSDISFSSTMGRKTLTSGSIGGLIYTKDELLFNKVRSLADRGKRVINKEMLSKEATENTDISLNFSADEFLCSIASSSLDRLPKAVKRRKEVLNLFSKNLADLKDEGLISILKYEEGCSPFVGLIQILNKRILEKKDLFISLLTQKGVPINGTNNQIAPLWEWLPQESASELKSLALDWRKNHISLFLHEGYSNQYTNKLSKKIREATYAVVSDN